MEIKLTRDIEYINSLNFYTPPEEGGQMVQYSFAQGEEETILMVSEYGKPVYYKVVEILSEKFEPWNSCPSFQTIHEQKLIIKN